MKNFSNFILGTLFLLALPAVGDEVMVAGSEEMDQVDAAIARSKASELSRGKSAVRPEDAEVGSLVAEEARKLKDADLETRKAFGKSVAEKRRRDREHRADGRGRGSVASGASGVSRPDLPSQSGSKAPENSSKGSRPQR